MAIMTEPAVPLPASTVVLIRPDGHGGTEVFMNLRPQKMQTYAGVYVFPGGCVEAADYSQEMLALTEGLTPARARATLNSNLGPELCLGHWVAAVRELFEEAGIHFFVSSDGTRVLDQEYLFQRLLPKRSALQAGQLTLAGLLNSERLHCNIGALTYFSHRITPEHYKIRFDTRFFVAALPVKQLPLHSSEEVVESLWISPQAALDRFHSGNFPMMPPTIAVLRILAEKGSWEELCAAVKLWGND
jgi:8-oxo-dGTP pyrophosphatase MutT (NUDIX family)